MTAPSLLHQLATHNGSIESLLGLLDRTAEAINNGTAKEETKERARPSQQRRPQRIGPRTSELARLNKKRQKRGFSRLIQVSGMDGTPVLVPVDCDSSREVLLLLQTTLSNSCYNAS